MATQRVPGGSSGLKYKKKNTKHNSKDRSTGPDMVFAELGAVELLRQDCRPSFIVDLMMEEENFELCVVFSNDAFKTYAGFREVASWLSGNSCQGGEAFIKWIYTQPRIAVNQYWFRQQRWSKVLLEDRWCVVSGHEMAFAKSTREDSIHPQSLRPKPAQSRSFDLCEKDYEIPFSFNQDDVPIRKAPGSFNPAMAAYAYFTPSPLTFETPFASFFCSKDWSSTALESISEQLLDMTSLISSFTQLSPIAMFIMDAKDGSVVFANEAWTRITGGTVEEHARLKWLDCVVDEDREFIAKEWYEVTVNKRPIRNQGRLKTPWKPAVLDPALFGKNEVYYTWAECHAVPLFNKDGNVEHVVGCLTDITHLRWTTRMQELRAKEALTETRQREEFMKMTSHELMNPLSAVVQCADTIISSLDEINKTLSTTHDNVLHDDNSKSYGEIKTIILRNIEIARIILGCGEHQKRIVDDARKMEKPNINLFCISPIRAEPIRVVDTAMTMLSGETSKLDISVQLKMDPSMEILDASWLCFDPSRFLQLLLNLLTNANKYTESSETRKVVVCLGATTGSPYHKEIGRDIQYIPLRTARNDPTLTDASGKGEIVYLHCSITDTGKGLSEKERRSLFQKLSEKFLCTHTQCGDASLGLLICRELAEL